MPHWLIIVFLFLLGSCIGSFLNVVVWRLPRGGWKSLFWPPSACPKCNHELAWYDNIPVFGWIFLGGKCRYCRAPVSAQYPIIEALTGLLFVFYYVAMFMWQWGPSMTVFDSFGVPEYITLQSIDREWAVYGLIMLMISALLAASLIDAALYIIPIELPWFLAIAAFVSHALIAAPLQPGTLSVGPAAGALTAGATVGLLIAGLLLWMKVLPRSFPEGEPLLDFERKAMEDELRERNAPAEEYKQLPPVATKSQIRWEIVRESLFVAIPVAAAIAGVALYVSSDTVGPWWRDTLAANDWLSGLLGSIAGAMTAAALIWFTRIIATLVVGRVAMGQGDTHLMVGIGAVLGAGPSVVVFFIAPFCGLVVGLYKLFSKGLRELPYGPYLSLAAGVTVIIYRYVEAYFRPHVEAIGDLVRMWGS